MPFKSKAQARYLHANAKRLGLDVSEWDRSTDWKHLPERTEKAKTAMDNIATEHLAKLASAASSLLHSTGAAVATPVMAGGLGAMGGVLAGVDRRLPDAQQDAAVRRGALAGAAGALVGAGGGYLAGDAVDLDPALLTPAGAAAGGFAGGYGGAASVRR